MSKKKVKRKVCSKCQKEKRVTEDFYLASSTLIHSDSRLGICKDCLDSIIDYDNPQTLINAMRGIDRPFLRDEYEGSKQSNKNKPFREYMRRLAMRQNRNLTYDDSEFEPSSNYKPKKNLNGISNTKDVNDEMVIKWGSNYSQEDINKLEQFYNDMIEANEITTPQHKAQLKLLCKLELEQNKALENGNIRDFKDINTQYNKLMENSGFRPIDRQGGDESTGLRTFSQIWEEIEKDGFIKPVEIEEHQDIVDKTIMYMSNYTRKLLNMQSLDAPPPDTPKADDP